MTLMACGPDASQGESSPISEPRSTQSNQDNNAPTQSPATGTPGGETDKGSNPDNPGSGNNDPSADSTVECYGTPTPSPTPESPTYTGEVITDWGCPPNDDDCRQDRAKQVWDWIKNSDTWWGNHKSPDPKDLATWLLEHEGGSLRNDQTKTYEQNGDKWLLGIHVMVGVFSHLFGDGDISPKDLSTFTAFFNPNRGNTFDSNDWRQITTQPPSFWRNDVNKYWDGGLVQDGQGHAIDR